MVSYYDIIENSHIVFGLFTNSLLVYVILRFTKKSMGTYKHLQLIFGLYDLFLVLLHAFLKPRVMVVNTTTFGVAADWDDRHITAFYCCCNTVPFVLMIIDFLYRYWCIASPHLIALFSNIKFIILMNILPIVEYFIWYFVAIFVMTGGEGPEIGKDLLRAESERRLGKEMHEGWLIMNHWENGVFNGRVFCALMTFNTIMLVCFSVSTLLGALTYYHIYVLGARSGAVSAKSLAMQRKLFVAVCAQTAIPFCFVYVPYICCINLPFLRLPLYFMDDACMLLTSCFPAWDGLIVIVLMPDYWKGLMGMICKKRTAVREIHAKSTVSSSQ